MIFEDNTEFITPLIINKLHIATSCLHKIYLQTLGFNKFLVIEAENVRISEDFLVKQEPNFYNISYGDKITIKYLIPSHLVFTCNLIEKTGYRGIDKDMLFDCISFWKQNAFNILVNEKTQTARESSLG